MTFHEFENEVRDTLAKYIRDKIEIERYTELILGLYEEGGEVTSIIRRSIPGNFHETKIDIPHLEEELGDILWYISHIAMQLNANLDRVAIANLQKIDTKNQRNYNRDCLSIKEYQQCVVSTYRKDLPKSQSEKARFFAMGMISGVGENKFAQRVLTELWKQVGMKVFCVEPNLHDSIVARVSHLPHLLAVTLCSQSADFENGDLREYSGPGFRDTTRVASGSPEMWDSICADNSVQILKALKDYSENLNKLIDAFEKSDADFIARRLRKAKQYRDGLDNAK